MTIVIVNTNSNTFKNFALKSLRYCFEENTIIVHIFIVQFTIVRMARIYNFPVEGIYQ